MGSSTVYHLAKNGCSVLGIDRYSPPHSYGSSHGDTRITRLSVHEGEEYIPLVRRSHELWREIEAASGASLLTTTGGILMGVHSGQKQHGSEDFLESSIAIAKKFGIRHEVFDADEIRRRYTEFNVTGSEEAYFEYEAGILRPEKCIQTQLDLAVEYGADAVSNEEVLSYEQVGQYIHVYTKNTRYVAKKVVICTGAWMKDFMPNYKELFSVYRQVLYWFDIKDKSQYEAYSKLPIFIWEAGSGPTDIFYGFPAVDGPQGGLKLAGEIYSEDIDASNLNREVSDDEIRKAYQYYVKDKLPGLSDQCVKSAACMYTVTPDHKFIIDRHPENENIFVASPCSGHGFKHSAAIGEVLAQQVLSGTSKIPIDKFSLSRFLTKAL